MFIKEASACRDFFRCNSRSFDMNFGSITLSGNDIRVSFYLGYAFNINSVKYTHARVQNSILETNKKIT